MNLLYSIHRKACKLLLAAAVLLPVTSCDTVWDDDDSTGAKRCPTLIIPCCCLWMQAITTW